MVEDKKNKSADETGAKAKDGGAFCSVSSCFNSPNAKAIAVALVIIGVFFAGKYFGGGISAGGSPSDARLEKAIAKWIDENPEAIIQSVAKMQQREFERRTQDSAKAILEKRDEIENDPTSPVYAKGSSDVVVVEFFDYSCGYCKRAIDVVEKLLAQDKNVKFVFKEFPILGAASEINARAALAVNLTNKSKYFDFHAALMKAKAGDEASVLKVAEKAGINSTALKKAMNDRRSEIDAILQKNRELAAAIGVNGTPGFIINGELIPGAVGLEDLKNKIAAARGKK